jgi:tetratricopeptide (TPR) repeat protein
VTGYGSDWRNREVIAISVLLVALVFGVFGQTIGHGFVNFDDDKYVYNNPLILKGLSIGGLRWALTYGDIGHWHPLTWVTHMLDCQLYGLWAGGHHLTNVLLHATAVVMLFLLLLQMTGALWRCAFVAAAWAIHPLRAESVAWISERKDVLSAVFFMLTLGAYIRYVRRPSTSRYVPVVIIFALGLLSKNMLVTLPCVLLLLDYWPLARMDQSREFPRLLKEKIPLLALSAISCVITLFLVPEQVGPADHIPLWLRIENAIVSCCIYLRQTIWPADLAPFYPNPTDALPFWEVAGSLALLCVISALAIELRKRRPYLLVGWLWYLGMLVPVMGLVQIGRDGHADRRTYLTQIGLWIAGTWLAADWAGERRDRRVMLGGVALGILCALPVAAYHQTTYWRDGETLWTHALESNPDNFIAHYDLGDALVHEGRLDEGIARLREALRMNPDSGDAHYDLGTALLQQGRAAEAMAEFREACRINPADAKAHSNLGVALCQQGRVEEGIAQYRQALEIDPAFAEAHGNLGYALFQLGRIDDAIAEYREALRIDPANAKASGNLGNALARQGHADEAIARYRETIRINPADADTYYKLAGALLQNGQPGEAIAQLEKAFDLQPADLTIENTLAWMLAAAPETSLRDGARAVHLATQASRASGGDNPVILRTLAAAYAQAGQFPDAVQTAQKALQLAERGGGGDENAEDAGRKAHSDAALVASLLREIKLYGAGQPFREAQ